jgi:protein SCO1/2
MNAVAPQHFLHRLRELLGWGCLAVCACAWLGLSQPALAEPLPTDKPLSPEMRVIDVDDQRGRNIDTELGFVDHRGNRVTLSKFLDGERPVLLTLNYYRCSVVCSVQLQGLADALAKLDWTPGDENFRVVTVSIDPREGPKPAAHKREMILESLGRGDDVDWQFLTGDALAIKALASQLGIGYAYDAEQDQYAHPAVAMFLTPEGKIAQYIYGLTFDPTDLKLALLEAGEGKVGTPMEKLFQSCFVYDPTAGKYGPTAFGIMRIGGGVTVLILGMVLLFYWRRERKSSRRHHSQPQMEASS